MDNLKITDLSVGDWVMYNDNPFRIYDVEESELIRAKRWDGDGVQYVAKHIDYFEPIPITTEFLEKNGCERLEDWNNPERLSYAADDYYATWWMGTNTWRCGVHNDNINELVIIAKAKYVHELQHALRLAGNTREIEL